MWYIMAWPSEAYQDYLLRRILEDAAAIRNRKGEPSQAYNESLHRANNGEAGERPPLPPLLLPLPYR